MRVGMGYDVHKLVENRPLILGGVDIPFKKGLLGHSDADVLVHAIIDATLGASGLGDIGRQFPDTDPTYKDVSSIALLEAVNNMIRSKGFIVNNLDATVVCERPKLKTYIDDMVKNVAKALNIDEEKVNIKATTTEGLGFEGEGLGISAHAIVSLNI